MQPGFSQWFVLRAPRGLLAAMAVIALGLLPAVPLMALDGPWEAAFGVIALNDTEYAPGYSDWRFLQVRRGMSAAEVRELLGPPLHVYADPTSSVESWAYSHSPHSTHYRIRTVRFEASTVVEIETGLFFD